MTAKFQKPTSERASARFKVDQTVLDYQGQLPRRVVYLRAFQNDVARRPIEVGKVFLENVSAHWSELDANPSFTQADNHWIFDFEKLPGEYFSISWALSSEEIEKLTPDVQPTFSVSAVKSHRDREYEPEIWGRLNVVRGKMQHAETLQMETMNNRKIIGFAIDNPNVPYRQAYRVWIDVIVSQPRFRKLVFEDPILYLQKVLEKNEVRS